MMTSRTGRKLAFRLLSAAAAIQAMPIATQAHAQAVSAQRAFDIPAQDLASALEAFSRQSGREILFDRAQTRGQTSRALRGTFDSASALRRLLADTGLSARAANSETFVIQASRQNAAVADAAPVADADSAGAAEAEVIVTGTRIRGVTTPSPLIEVTEEDVRKSGYTDIGEVIRAIPQNFGGGQNPGIQLGSGGSGTNANLSSGSALNLRGLGADATLTVLNGRRLSYNGFTQAVDVSVIPIGALSRIEIVPDGASAIYGSDAVAGVANIILKQDYDGLAVGGGFRLPTGGGGEQFQMGATGGRRWATGGFILGYEYTDVDEIFSDQRDYTQYIPDPAQIYPSSRQHSAIFSGHQSISDGVTVRLDALYTRRDTQNIFYTLPTQRARQFGQTDIFTIAPSAEIKFAPGWTLTVGGHYGRDRTIAQTRTTSLAGVNLTQSRNCYCNTSYSAEFDVEGPLIALPGGDLRAVVGGGYRGDDFELVNFGATATTTTIAGDRTSHYAFGELYVPIFGPQMAVPLIHRFAITAAGRYEGYGALGDVATPRVGVEYEPTPDFGVKGSWGRSFKTPTLLQQFQATSATLFPASSLGGQGLPANATVILTGGGNPDLQPEKARTWSATLSVHPRIVPGLRIEVSYFDVDYRGRVLAPIANRPRTLIDPAYAAFLVRNPPAALQGQVIAAAPAGLTNGTGSAYNSANVVAIAYNQFTNVAVSRTNGIDASASYRFDIAGGQGRVHASATWLDGDRQNIAGQPAIDIVGTIFNPTDFRARGGFDWTSKRVTLATFVNHTAAVLDNRQTPAMKTGSFTTLDMTLRYGIAAATKPSSGADIALSIQNLLDQAPPLFTPQFTYLVNYDSTNYSAVGRVISLTLSKRW